MKNFFKNKFLIILFLFMILTFSIFTNCFAYLSDSFKVNYNDNNYIIVIPPEISISEINYYFCIRYGSVFYIYCVINQDYNVIKFGDKKNGTTPCKYLTICDNSGNVVSGDISLGYWFSYSPSTGDYGTIYEMTGNSYCINDYLAPNSFDFLYSTQDAYDLNTGKMVFPSAPPRVEQITIPQIAQVQEIPQTMNKVLALVIPIGLIVFLIGLLIYLVRLVILRMT